MSRRRSRGPARCNGCQAIVAWFIDAGTGKWRKYDPKPLAAHQPAAAAAHPVWGGQAWRNRDDLVAELEPQLGDVFEAVDHVRDLPWYRPHYCVEHAGRVGVAEEGVSP